MNRYMEEASTSVINFCETNDEWDYFIIGKNITCFLKLLIFLKMKSSDSQQLQSNMSV